MIPVRSALLPSTEALVPYLDLIEKNRWYSNFGDLLGKFEAKLAKHFAVQPENVVCVNNGTSAIMAALAGVDAAKDKYCVMPSWTFVATPAAATWYGMKPFFVDVSIEDWAIDPQILRTIIEGREREIGAIVPVSPFGYPLDACAWHDFAMETGIPVVIDGAWAFGQAEVSDPPTCVSLHATKAFGIGEGGLIVSTNADLISKIRRVANFNLGEGRLAQGSGANFKMDEFSAAVGLAMFDRWEKVSERLESVGRAYAQRLSRVAGVSTLPKWGQEWFGPVCAVTFDDPVGKQCRDALEEAGIEGRLWWNKPCHIHPAYQSFERGDLTNTSDLMHRAICLPCYEDLPDSALEATVDIVARLAGS